MLKKQKNLGPKVLFNASVILSGFGSPSGGSARVLQLAGTEIIRGVISEIIKNEVTRHADKVKLSQSEVGKRLNELGMKVVLSPRKQMVEKFMKVTIDDGDAHVLATAWELGVDYLVTLDRKHLLVLKGKVGRIKIVTPGELFEEIG
jgi:predicted nucleic acid-binding protein